MSLATRILIAMGLGAAAGLFFGELVAPLQPIGDAYIQLMQMTVLPYILVSLITGLGKLTYQQAGLLARRGGLILAIFWVLALATLCLMALGLPDWKSATFFSTSLVEEPEATDFLSLYIPANPFRSLAEGIVPAVVLFSLLCGVAVIGLEAKERIIAPLDAFQDVLTRVADLIVQLSPIGIFAIVAYAAGTISPQEFGRLRVYFLTYWVTWAIMTFWAVPAFVSALTPLRTRQILSTCRGALLTAFATQNLFIVLPLLAHSSKRLLADAELEGEDTDTFVDVVLPVAFTFPSTGLLLTLSFIPFAAWFSGSALSWAQYPGFLSAALISAFGKIWVTMPFLMDFLRIPIDLFQLFVAANVVIAPFQTLLSAIQIIVLVLLSTCAVQGSLQLRKARLLRYAGVTVGLLVVGLLGTRVFLERVVGSTYDADQAVMEMRLPGPPVETTVLTGDEPAAAAPPKPKPRSSFLSRIFGGSEEEEEEAAAPAAAPSAALRDGLRVCYDPEALPFAYVNARGELVGLDIDMAHEMARELGQPLSFYQTALEDFEAALNRGACDIVMSGYAVTPRRARRMAFSTPYLEGTLAFVVRDFRREDFTSRESVRRLGPIRLAMLKTPYYRDWIREALPEAEVVDVPHVRAFFEGEVDADALVVTAEMGSAWSLLDPGFTAVVPKPGALKVPLAYAVRRDDRRTHEFLNTWVALKQRDGTIDRAFDYWIRGKGTEATEPRWSIVRNVLGWVE
ncbi:MAG: cation:dicarboxylase symporter family transporter [Myxococcota bacterium]|nr:cation:dicarboxylase symporter family transporter [Myxococcota bacterium]